jgi:hypothetical protein
MSPFSSRSTLFDAALEAWFAARGEPPCLHQPTTPPGPDGFRWRREWDSNPRDGSPRLTVFKTASPIIVPQPATVNCISDNRRNTISWHTPRLDRCLVASSDVQAPLVFRIVQHLRIKLQRSPGRPGLLGVTMRTAALFLSRTSTVDRHILAKEPPPSVPTSVRHLPQLV